jgi:hypothetical protein
MLALIAELKTMQSRAKSCERLPMPVLDKAGEIEALSLCDALEAAPRSLRTRCRSVLDRRDLKDR